MLKRWLVGNPLKTSQAAHQRLSKLVALAVFSSDALSSVAYATEEILLILILAGAVALGLSIPISIAIVLLLIILTVSYRQIIYAYPEGGGAYIVAKSNIGTWAGLVAAAAPAVLLFVGHAQVALFDGELGELIDQVLVDRLGRLAHDLETAERDGTGSETHTAPFAKLRHASIAG